MTPAAQRIAIAEACGYWPTMRGVPVWYERDGGHVVFNDLPDYLNDLNAMHEAEKALNEEQMCDYIQKYIRESCPTRWTCATAAQRAEAFLRTLNLWRP